MPIKSKCSQKCARPNSSGLSVNEPIFTVNEAALFSDSGSLTNNAFNPFGRIFIKQSNLSLFDFSIEVIIDGSFSYDEDIF